MVTIKPVKKDLVHAVGLNNIPYFFHPWVSTVIVYYFGWKKLFRLGRIQIKVFYPKSLLHFICLLLIS